MAGLHRRLRGCPASRAPSSPWQNYPKIAGGDQVCGKATMVPSTHQRRESAAGSAKRPPPGTAESVRPVIYARVYSWIAFVRKL